MEDLAKQIADTFQTDITNFEPEDQLKISLALVEFYKKVKPIYLKYELMQPETVNFLFKM